MSHLITSEIKVIPDLLEQFPAMVTKVRETLGNQVRLSVYREHESSTKFLMVTSGIEGDPEIHSSRFFESDVYPDYIAFLEEAPSTIISNLTHRRGLGLEDLQPGQFMSLGYRQAEPGRLLELEAELDTIFAGLEPIPDMLGFAYGPSLTASEAVLSLVGWNSVEGFAASRPMQVLFKIKGGE
ncbi:MAG: hypothetical protein K8R88_09250, partial [Armatimonadetes bacterium]|nr:hypothetical protein [Armatimonadota bacterium]